MVIDLLDLAAELVDIPSESHEETALADLFERRLRDGSNLAIDLVGAVSYTHLTLPTNREV